MSRPRAACTAWFTGWAKRASIFFRRGITIDDRATARGAWGVCGGGLAPRRLAPRAKPQRDQRQGIYLTGGIEVLPGLELLQRVHRRLGPGAAGIFGFQVALGGQRILDFLIPLGRRRQLPVAPRDTLRRRPLLPTARGGGLGAGFRSGGAQSGGPGGHRLF